MDDTLLDNHQKISPRNEAAIKQAAAQGIKVVFATGRMFISAQTYAKELGMDLDRLNVNGGAIALGHPLGMSGARLVQTVVQELHNRGERYGLATMCIGVGQGIAMIVERV